MYEASYVLADYLCRHQALVQNKKVIELGSGLGLVSVVCAKLGAASVLATDGDDLSVSLTKSNLESNNCQEIATSEKLLWGSQQVGETEPLADFDLVVGSDIVACPYAEAYESLLDTLKELMPAVDVTSFDMSCVASQVGRRQDQPNFLLSYQPRNQSEDQFFTTLAKAGFLAHEIEREDIHSDFQDTKIKLFCISRKSPSEP